VEGLFGEALRVGGLEVERPVQPTSLEVSNSDADLFDPSSYPVKVCRLSCIVLLALTEISRYTLMVSMETAVLRPLK
jgi:hypothetical protein